MMDGQDHWYGDGLAFECTQCGDCCTGAPGYVWVGQDEIVRLAGGLNMTVESFGTQYLRYARNRLSLIEKPNGDCVFWDSTTGCRVYEHRPDQCRSWPFWNANLESKSGWNAVSEHCPGCNQGKQWNFVEIQQTLKLAPDRLNWPES